MNKYERMERTFLERMYKVFRNNPSFLVSREARQLAEDITFILDKDPIIMSPPLRAMREQQPYQTWVPDNSTQGIEVDQTPFFNINTISGYTQPYEEMRNSNSIIQERLQIAGESP